MKILFCLFLAGCSSEVVVSDPPKPIKSCFEPPKCKTRDDCPGNSGGAVYRCLVNSSVGIAGRCMQVRPTTCYVDASCLPDGAPDYPQCTGVDT